MYNMYISTSSNYKLRVSKALHNLPPDMIKQLHKNMDVKKNKSSAKKTNYLKKWLKSHVFSIFL